MKNYKLSVIIPVYNSEKYISQALNSVLNQKYTNYEVIIICDSSCDNSGIICDEYERKDAHVKVFHRNKGKIGSARTMGIEHCTGDYIIFLDSDDWLAENSLPLAAQYIEKYPEYDIYIFDYYKETNKSERKFFFEEENKFFEDIKEREYLMMSILQGTTQNKEALMIAPPWGKIYKRSTLGHICFPDLGYEDVIYNIRAVYNSKKIMYIQKPFYHYRYNNMDSILHRMNEERLKENLDFFDEFMNMCNEYKLDERFYDIFYRVRTVKVLISTILGFSRPDNKMSTKEKILKVRSLFDIPYFKKTINLYRWNNRLKIKENVFCILLKNRCYRIVVWIMEVIYYHKSKILQTKI